MNSIIFQDLSHQEIQVQISGGGDYRIYVTSTIPEKSGFKSMCLLLNKAQANILINALKDLMRKEQ